LAPGDFRIRFGQGIIQIQHGMFVLVSIFPALHAQHGGVITGKMRSFVSALLAVMAIAVVGVVMSTCTGSDPCYACKYCKHCAKDGGTCGVCKKQTSLGIPFSTKCNSKWSGGLAMISLILATSSANSFIVACI